MYSYAQGINIDFEVRDSSEDLTKAENLVEKHNIDSLENKGEYKLQHR